MKSSAAGTQSQAVGSKVPVQSNSRWKRRRSARGELAPWLIDERADARRGGRRARAGTPRPSARTPTCAGCRCSRRRRAAARSSGSIPGAWAPSTSVSMPRAASSATSRSTGRTSAGRAGDVVDQQQARARGDARQHRARRPRRAMRSGRGRRATTTRAPGARRPRTSSALRQALYSWSVTSSSSPSREGERAQHGVHARRRVGDEGQAVAASAPRKRGQRARAPRRGSGSSSRTMKRTGSRSSRAPVPVLRRRAPAAAWRRTSRGSGR